MSQAAQDIPSGSIQEQNITASANKLLQEAKAQLDQSGNLKTTIKEAVLNSLTGLHNMCVNLSETRQSLLLEVERLRLQLKEELLEVEKEHSKRLAELVGNNPQSAPFSVDKILRELDTIRRDLPSKVAEKLSAVRGPSSSSDSSQEWSQLLSEVKVLRQAAEETGRQITSLKEYIPTTPYAPTYAHVLSRPKTTPRITMPSHSIIVSSDQEKDTSDEVLGKVREALDAKTSGIQVSRVRKVKNQKIVLSCGSKDDLDKLTNKIMTNGNLRVEEAKQKDPLVIIKDLLTYNTDDDIIASLKSQNKSILGDLSDEDIKASVRYRRKARNPHENHVVLQVSPRLWQRLTSAGKVHIDLQYVSVLDQSPLVQCTRCLGYGHGRKTCSDDSDRCSYCGGKHLRVECPSHAAAETPVCCNCKAAKYQETAHSAFALDCPIRRKWDNIARSSVSYCC